VWQLRRGGWESRGGGGGGGAGAPSPPPPPPPATVAAWLPLGAQVTALEELLTRYGTIDRLWWDNYALDGSRYQPVTHEGFVCPGDVLNATACPAWQVMIDTVRRVSPSTAVIPGPDGCLVDAESYGGTYPVYHATPLPEGAYWCAGGATGSPGGGSTFTVVESE
jgi:hypothetical protein